MFVSIMMVLWFWVYDVLNQSTNQSDWSVIAKLLLWVVFWIAFWTWHGTYYIDKETYQSLKDKKDDNS